MDTTLRSGVFLSFKSRDKELNTGVVRRKIIQDFFANSFLIECSDALDIGVVTSAMLNTNRNTGLNVGTAFHK